MRLETCIRKAFGMKSHYVVGVEESEAGLVAQIERLANRKLRCGSCGLPASGIHNRGRARKWKDLAVRDQPLWLQYRPYRVRCFRCGVRTERVP
jgi:transposase